MTPRMATSLLLSAARARLAYEPRECVQALWRASRVDKSPLPSPCVLPLQTECDLRQPYPRTLLERVLAPPVLHSDPETGADAYTWFEGRTMHVAFRGTQDHLDALADIDVRLVPPTPSRKRHARPPPEARVHRGFNRQLESLLPEIQERVEELQDVHGGAGRLMFTGHSLGGALAVLCATHFAGGPVGVGVPHPRGHVAHAHGVRAGRPAAARGGRGAARGRFCR